MDSLSHQHHTPAPHQLSRPDQPAVEGAASEELVPQNRLYTSRQDILFLQRLVGNQGVQRMIAAGQITPHPSLRVQRAPAPPPSSDQGLLASGAAGRFAQKVFAFTSDPKNAEVGVADLTTVMEKALNDEMNAAGIPPVYVYFSDAGGNMAWFVSGDWKMEINPDLNFGSILNTVKDITQDQLEEAADTIYHEARHAEQDFRIAQLQAMELGRSGLKPDDIKKQLQATMGIAGHAIDAAIASPLSPATDPAVVAEIRQWATSMYGADKIYRDMVYRLYPEAVEPLVTSAEAILNLVPPEYPHVPQADLDKIKADLPALLVNAGKDFQTLLNYQVTTLLPELQRIATEQSKKPDSNSVKMIEHLSRINVGFNKLTGMNPIPADPDKAAGVAMDIKSTAGDIKDELLRADLDLPEQADAVDAGTAARNELDQLHNQP